MTAQRTAQKMAEEEVAEIEKLAGGVEISVVANNLRHDLKERRKINKLTLFDGSHKLKHLIPKGKHL